MSTRLILVRHAASHHKEQGIVAGPRLCRGLTELGRQQAMWLGERMVRNNSLAPAHIYTSIIPRAIETAHILAEAFGKTSDEVQQDCDLCSWHIPAAYEGMPVQEFQQQFGAIGGGVFRPFETGNESWAELVGRTGRALWGIAQRHQGETSLIVAHTETVAASLSVFGDLPLMRYFEVSVANASLTEWITEEDPTTWPPARWTMARLNDAAHLEP